MRSTAQRPLAKKNISGLTEQAVDKHELAHGPADPRDRLLIDAAHVVKQREVRRGLPRGEPRFGQRATERFCSAATPSVPSPSSTSGSCPAFPEKLMARSNATSNGAIATDAAASIACAAILSGKDGYSPMPCSET